MEKTITYSHNVGLAGRLPPRSKNNMDMEVAGAWANTCNAVRHNTSLQCDRKQEVPLHVLPHQVWARVHLKVLQSAASEDTIVVSSPLQEHAAIVPAQGVAILKAGP